MSVQNMKLLLDSSTLGIKSQWSFTSHWFCFYKHVIINISFSINSLVLILKKSTSNSIFINSKTFKWSHCIGVNSKQINFEFNIHSNINDTYIFIKITTILHSFTKYLRRTLVFISLGAQLCPVGANMYSFFGTWSW